MDAPSAVSAAASPLPALPELPVRPANGRAAIAALEAFAHREGLDPQVRGFAQPPRAYAHALTHLAVLAVAWGVGPFSGGVAAVIALVVGVSSLLRRWGQPPLLPGPPGELGWNLVLAPRSPATRVLLAGALDLGARPRGEVELVTAVAALVALGALGILSPFLVAVAWGLTVAWVLVARWRRPVVDLARMARVAMDIAALGRPELAVVVSSGGAETAAGAWSFLDWWALPPPTLVIWMGDPWAVEDLVRRGYAVRVVPPQLPAVLAALDSRG